MKLKFLIFFALLCGFAVPLWAQQVAQPPAAMGDMGPLFNWRQGNAYNQITTGYSSLGFVTHPYNTLTGMTDFAGEFDSQLAINYSRMIELEGAGFLQGWGFGGGVNKFTASTLSTAFNATGSWPRIDSKLYTLSGEVVGYFQPLKRSIIIPKIALGWGYLTGTMRVVDGGQLSGVTVNDTVYISGPLIYRSLGLDMPVASPMGMTLEMRMVNASLVSAGIDPYSQAGANGLILDFSGVTMNLHFAYRF